MYYAVYFQNRERKSMECSNVSEARGFLHGLESDAYSFPIGVYSKVYNTVIFSARYMNCGASINVACNDIRSAVGLEDNHMFAEIYVYA